MVLRTLIVNSLIEHLNKYMYWQLHFVINKNAISVMENEEKTDWRGIWYEILLGVSEGAYKLLCLLQHSNIIKKISGAQEREKSSFFDGHYSALPSIISSTTPLTFSVCVRHRLVLSSYTYFLFVFFFFIPFWFQHATFLSSFWIR